jgi:hypothetical protein
MIDAAKRELVRRRAGACGEYCGLSQAAEPFFSFHIEHIIARQHGAGDGEENLALACYHCNCRKGTNLTAIDPLSGNVVPLFHPRMQQWPDHFTRAGDLIEGSSAIGRATVSLLRMNSPDRRRLRG